VRSLQLVVKTCFLEHIGLVYNKYTFDQHGLRLQDIQKTNKQNWASTQKICQLKVHNYLKMLQSCGDTHTKYWVIFENMGWMHGMLAHFQQMLHSIKVHKKFAKEHGYLFIIIYDYNHLWVDVHTFVNIHILFLNLTKMMMMLVVLMDAIFKKS